MLNRLNNQHLPFSAGQILALEPSWRGWRVKSRLLERSNASPRCAWPSVLDGSSNFGFRGLKTLLVEMRLSNVIAAGKGFSQISRENGCELSVVRGNHSQMIPRNGLDRDFFDQGLPDRNRVTGEA